jgi:hypothetical protein
MAIDVTPYPEHLKLLSTPEANHLAELYLLQADLDKAHATLSLYFEKFAFFDGMREGAFATISASLFRDGIMLYCACFATDNDADKLDPHVIYDDVEGGWTYCEKLLAIRDTFVAHNFGPMRQHNIVVIVLEIGGELIPAAFSQVHFRFAGWIAEEGKRLLPHIDLAREHLKGRIEEAEKLVQDTLTTISSDELAALPEADGFRAPEDRDIRTSRARFRSRARGEPLSMPPRRWVQTIEDELESRHSDPLPDDPDGAAPPSERGPVDR